MVKADKEVMVGADNVTALIAERTSPAGSRGLLEFMECADLSAMVREARARAENRVDGMDFNLGVAGIGGSPS